MFSRLKLPVKFFQLRKIFIFAFSIVLSASLANAEVFYAQDEAMKIAFPNADEVKTKTLFIQGSNIEYIQKLSRSKIDSGLFTFFVAVSYTHLTLPTTPYV